MVLAAVCAPNNKMNNKPTLINNFKKYHNTFIMISSAVVFITMALGLTFQTQEAPFISTVKASAETMPAEDLSVVGKPTLPAATVDTIFKSLGSPMNGTGQVVVQASQQANIDDAFALAVWWTETNDGAAGVGLADRNPGSVRGSVGYPSAYDGYTIYPSYSAAIVYWFNMLKNLYVNRGLSTVYLISHPYVGTSSSPLWAGKVETLMLKYHGEAPPAPIVVPHGKRVTEPTVYIHITPTPILLEQHAQSQVSKTLKLQSSNIVRQVKTAPVLSPSIEYAIVFFALLIALAIVACALWLGKRPGQTMQDKGAQLTTQNKDVQNTVAQAVSTPGISPLQDRDAIPPDTAFPQNAGANFRIRRTILLPSIPGTETAKTGELPVGSSLRGRSTGLLSRYGETNQE